ncbi:MAG: hypothetical protein RLZZ241_744 [Bacteroidota bacterium]|jgi:hypothetical protein
MRVIGIFITYFFHPFLSPCYGLLVVQTNLSLEYGRYWPVRFYLPLFLLTFMLPLLSFILGRSLSSSRKLCLSKTAGTLLSVLVFIASLIFILFGPIPMENTPVIYYYYLGLILASFTYLLLKITGNAVDPYPIGIGSLLGLLIGLAVNFEINLTTPIATVVLLSGILMSLRLYIKQRGNVEIITGLLIGGLSQLILLQIWY